MEKTTDGIFENRIAALARALFANLRASEIDLDEPLRFCIGPLGHLFLSVDRTGDMFALYGDHAIRIRKRGDVAELTAWHGGHLVEMDTRPEAELVTWLRDVVPVS